MRGRGRISFMSTRRVDRPRLIAKLPLRMERRREGKMLGRSVARFEAE